MINCLPNRIVVMIKSNCFCKASNSRLAHSRGLTNVIFHAITIVLETIFYSRKKIFFLKLKLKFMIEYK